MSETTGHSRWRHFMLMLPFFLIGVAIPVYFFGFSGDGPPNMQATDTFNPQPSLAPPADESSPSQRTYRRSYGDRGDRPGVVGFARGVFKNVVDTYVSPGLPRWLIGIGFVAALFVGGFIVLRIVLALIYGTLGGLIAFLVHKAAAPMFMGFLAVGSTWSIHQTIADQFGMQWAATTVTLTAAVAALFALAGVRVR